MSNIEKISEASRYDQGTRCRRSLQKGIRGYGRAHFDRLDACGVDLLASRDEFPCGLLQDPADALGRGIAVVGGIVAQELDENIWFARHNPEAVGEGAASIYRYADLGRLQTCSGTGHRGRCNNLENFGCVRKPWGFLKH